MRKLNATPVEAAIFAAKTDYPMRSLLALLILLCVAFSCSNCTETTATTTPPTEVAPAETAPNTSIVKPIEPLEPLPGEKVVRGNKRLDPQSNRLLFELVQNYWYLQAFLKIGDLEFNKQNRGRWFHFNEDGTYESGYLADTGKGGKWTYDEATATLHLQADDFNKSGEYRVKMGQSGAVMIWEGTERYQQTSIQGKLEKYNRIGDYELPVSQ